MEQDISNKQWRRTAWGRLKFELAGIAFARKIGQTPEDIHHIPLRHIITSFLITTVLVVTILVPLPGSHPLNGDMASALFSLLA